MSASNYLEDKLLDWLNGTNMPTAPAALYVALFNGDPTDAGSGGTEVTTTIRVAGRVAVTLGSKVTNAGANTRANSAIVDFGLSAGSATVDYFAVMDASSAGNMLISAPLTASRSVTTGVQCSFAIGDLVLSVN